jgi:hypothetical protein
MPPSRRVIRTPVRPAGRRRLEWATTAIADNAKANGTVNVTDLLSNFVAAGGSREGLTVIRVRAQLAFAAASAGGNARIGLQVDELTASGTQLDPVVNPYQAWMLNMGVFPTTSGATVDASFPFHLDLKGKRKIGRLQETLWFTWKPNDTGTTSMIAVFRVLVALP